MPWTMLAFTAAAVSMVGVPPTAGFFSKFYLVQAGMARDMWGVALVVLLSGLLTAAYMVRILERVYLRKAPDDGAAADAADPPADMLWPALALASATLVLGLANVPIMTRLLIPAVSP